MERVSKGYCCYLFQIALALSASDVTELIKVAQGNRVTESVV